MPVVVAIPARNEEAHIRACLEALDGQVAATVDHIVLLANNCTDATASIAAAVTLHSGATLHVLEKTLPPHIANAGAARRRVMEAGLRLAGPDGILIATDADGQVDADWLASTLAAMARGAEVVAGWVDLHPLDWGRIPMRLHEDDARECAYDALCDEIHARLDPDLHDPWPRHTQHSGASIAVTVEAYLRCGGIPDVASGEDRALIEALRLVDARIRHDPAVHVSVSGRIEGRAEGGMAETIRRRMVQPDEYVDDRLEPAEICALRARCRATARRAYERPDRDVGLLVGLLSQPVEAVQRALNLPHFGLAWKALEDSSPSLQRIRVPVSRLGAETVSAEAILRPIRAADALVEARWVA
ncbi:glycosyltransferase family 2 protein [Acidisphaera sp. L21]|uniref:glycosyltransferase n=1 Tax=Acidisphaera sp. L21 TaxID=1641851 RepID=UPI00131EAE3D|nr:glycosyltransferase [Acidisphaera sp. L21]